MAVAESHPLACPMEEFLHILRDHVVGLNPARWDYTASLIHFMLEAPRWAPPDRNTIPHDVSFFQFPEGTRLGPADFSPWIVRQGKADRRKPCARIGHPTSCRPAPLDKEIWMSGIHSGLGPGFAVPVMSREELLVKMKDPSVAVVDVLPRESFAEQHLPGAVSLPASEVSERAGALLPDPTQEIVLYCWSST